jgi:adenosylhomocysteine nucleosidase
VVYDIYERSGGQDEQAARYMTELDLSLLDKPYPQNALPARMATADQDLDPDGIPYLWEKYGAVAADWESGAIAYVAQRNNNTKCLIVRGVSDVVDPDGGKPSSDEDILEGTKIVMKKLIDSLPEWIAKVR